MRKWPRCDNVLATSPAFPSSIPSDSHRISGRVANLAFVSVTSASWRLANQGFGESIRATRSALPLFNMLVSGRSAVARITTPRRWSAASRTASSAKPLRASQSWAAVQPLSTSSTIGPVPAMVSVRPICGADSAAITAAAASSRSSISHQGVPAGVCSSSRNPSRSLSGGNTTRLGKGGVTRSRNQISGSTIRANSTQGAPKLMFANQFMFAS